MNTKHIKLKTIVTPIFLTFYLLFIWLDFSFNCNIFINYIKFSIIILSFIVALLGNNNYVKLSLFLTVLCDYLFLFTSNHTLAVALFCIVQIFYIIKNTDQTKKAYAIGMPLLALSAVYALLFILNIYTSIKSCKLKPSISNKEFLLGLLLFACCDILVAAYNITNINILSDFIWIFYAPSQFIIAISTISKQ